MSGMIQFPRKGLDGRLYSQKEIEDAFKKDIVSAIENRLGAIKTKNIIEKKGGIYEFKRL